MPTGLPPKGYGCLRPIAVFRRRTFKIRQRQIGLSTQPVAQKLAVIRCHGSWPPQNIHCGGACIFVPIKQRKRTQEQGADVFRLPSPGDVCFKLRQALRHFLNYDLQDNHSFPKHIDRTREIRRRYRMLYIGRQCLASGMSLRRLEGYRSRLSGFLSPDEKKDDAGSDQQHRHKHEQKDLDYGEAAC